MKIPKLFPPAILAVLVIASAACSRDGADAAKNQAAPPPPEVAVIEARYGSAVLRRELPGRLEAYRTAQVRARVEGILEKRFFEEGSEVKEGQLLYRIDPRTYQRAFEAAKADVAATKLLVERYRPLVKINAISRQEYDSAEAAWKQAEARLAQAALDLENTRVPASISGRIGRSLVTEGALVGKGEPTHLATIEQIDPIYVNFTQPSTELLALREALRSGQWKEADRSTVEIVLDNGKTYPLPAKLLFEDVSVDPATGAVLMRALAKNPEHVLLPGMFVRVRLPQMQMDKVITVPQRAVQINPQGHFVMVVDANNTVAPRAIKVGGMSGTDWVVLEGLQEGEKVVVEGLLKVRAGAPVKPLPWQPKNTPAAAAPSTAAK
ncbi:MAG: efflux RND transporter periplasmic adaptor subunit [Rhodocyclales bacterium]|nr:efflux RND transporter periplasmic adaptor subunit [Rhodocyclales bacterium]